MREESTPWSPRLEGNTRDGTHMVTGKRKHFPFEIVDKKFGFGTRSCLKSTIQCNTTIAGSVLRFKVTFLELWSQWKASDKGRVLPPKPTRSPEARSLRMCIQATSCCENIRNASTVKSAPDSWSVSASRRLNPDIEQLVARKDRQKGMRWSNLLYVTDAQHNCLVHVT